MADHDPSHAPHGYEESDVSATPVFVSVVLLLALAAIVSLAVAVFMGVLTGPFGLSGHAGAERPREAAPSPSPSPSGGPDSPVWPDEDYHAEFAEQEKRLGEAGWVDRGRGVVYVPIERAMELTVQRLPVRGAR